ncbi:glycosyltransferase [Ornithinimicrobium pekingense]|uniref:Teichuronic acid biosynthesis glycosyltransferase TuaH n=1 Tax=Ornithinimicrobium pekingense TaxID=384677 RepID=A0ABQ2F8Y1_9MICO|nr:glycosyltransferase [Ornithinimicrobium pekingense]GGK71265.1 hypothetical protein GCM10011509_19700 [Ornithinimicrobium pekingense]
MTGDPGSGVVYLGGTDWAHVAATDRHLTLALADLLGPSLYVDPVVSVSGTLRRRLAGEETVPMGLSTVAPRVTRLRTLGPPFLTRRGVFPLTRALQAAAVRHAVARCGIRPVAVVLATPWNSFVPGLPGHRVLYLTDDWEAGAVLTGKTGEGVRGQLGRELARADLACAVTPVLVDKLSRLDPDRPVELVPNGCALPARDMSAQRPGDLPAGPLVGLVGQVNERLDLDVLHAIVDSGMSLVVIGPLTCSSPAITRRFQALFARQRVTWLGRKAPEELSRYLPHLTVGVTPYRIDDFNRASFPLKTLEYLAYGLPVVASDLPAAQWLGSELVDIATTSEDFVALVARRYAEPPDPATADLRRRLAGAHTWQHRAAQLVEALTSRSPSRA